MVYNLSDQSTDTLGDELPGHTRSIWGWNRSWENPWEPRIDWSEMVLFITKKPVTKTIVRVRMTGTVLFIAVENPVRAVFIGANGKTEQSTVFVAVKLIWEGTESEVTAPCLRSGVFRETNENTQYIQDNDNSDRQSSQQLGHFHLHKYRMTSAHRGCRFHA